MLLLAAIFGYAQAFVRLRLAVNNYVMADLPQICLVELSLLILAGFPVSFLPLLPPLMI